MRWRVQWMPGCSIQTGVDECDQRWTTTPDVFSGTAAEAAAELSSLQTDYGSGVVFRLVPLPVEPEDESPEEQARWCEGCGGDVTAPVVDDIACRCRPSVRAAAGASGVRVAVKEAM